VFDCQFVERGAVDEAAQAGDHGGYQLIQIGDLPANDRAPLRAGRVQDGRPYIRRPASRALGHTRPVI
jgi:hypothetical protein